MKMLDTRITVDAKKFGLILAIQAEIEGMKAENMLRQQTGEYVCYGQDCFFNKAEQFRELANKED
jgi:hypothetical protein